MTAQLQPRPDDGQGMIVHEDDQGPQPFVQWLHRKAKSWSAVQGRDRDRPEDRGVRL